MISYVQCAMVYWKTLFIVLAVFGLTKLLGKKYNSLKGKIIEGEIVEENKEKEVKFLKKRGLGLKESYLSKITSFVNS